MILYRIRRLFIENLILTKKIVMKKNLIFLFALLCTVTFFTACSDDDKKTITFQELAEEYTGDNLVFTINGETKNNTITLTEATTPTRATVTAAKLKFTENSELVLGVKGFEMDVNLVADGDYFKIEGEYKYNDFLTFVVNGTVNADKMELSLTTPKYAELKKDIVGTWKVKTNEGKGDVIFNLTTASGNLTFPKELKDLISSLDPALGTLESMPTSTINSLVNTLLSQYIVQLNSLEFTNTLSNAENAAGSYNLNISYTKVGSTTPESLNGLLVYSWQQDGMYVGVNLAEIIKLVPTRSFDGSSLLSEGILFHTEMKDGVLTLSVDKNILNLTLNTLKEIIEWGILDYMLPQTPEVQQIYAQVKILVPVIVSMLSEVETLDVGINLTK